VPQVLAVSDPWITRVLGLSTGIFWHA
jgi:hypothetical protein